MSDETTLNLTLNHTVFKDGLRQHIEERIAKKQAAYGPRPAAWQKRHLSALFDLNNYLSGCDLADQRLYALSVITAATEGDHGHNYKPTHQQEILFARLGEKDVPPPPDTTLSELVAAAALDLMQSHRAAKSRAQTVERHLEEKDAEIASAAQRVSEANDALMSAQGEINSLREENKDLEESIEELRRHLGDGDAPGKKAKQPQVTRGPVHPDHPGVYPHSYPDKTIWEINWRQQDGKNRWKKVGPDLEEAVALRADLLSQLHSNQKEEVAV